MSTFRTNLNRIVVTLITLIGLMLTSCGSHHIGYGVVLWSANEQLLPTGSVVSIADESKISKTYTIPVKPSQQGGGVGKTTSVKLPLWRIAFFKSRQEAVTYQKSFEKFRDVYARSDRNALPIRTDANPSAEMLYKLRQGETIKVLGRSPKPVNESGLEAYWYRVITQTGVSGWVFGYLLTVYDQGTPQGKPPAQANLNPMITLITGTVWRPVYFSQMIQSGQFDLSKFDPKYGFFSDPAHKRFNLVLPDYAIAFDYSDLKQMEPNRYSAEGSSLLITVRGARSLSLQYSYNDNIVSTVVEKIDMDVTKVIAAEKKRRADLYATLIDHGNRLVSTAYGHIDLAPDNSFSWSGVGPLVPNVIPATAVDPQGTDASGTVEFSLYLSDALKNTYDGVVTFKFTGADNSQTTSFLFSYASNGVRFVYVPQSTIKDNVVLKESFSPLIVFFTFANSAN